MGKFVVQLRSNVEISSSTRYQMTDSLTLSLLPTAATSKLQCSLCLFCFIRSDPRWKFTALLLFPPADRIKWKAYLIADVGFATLGSDTSGQV